MAIRIICDCGNSISLENTSFDKRLRNLDLIDKFHINSGMDHSKRDDYCRYVDVKCKECGEKFSIRCY